MTLRSHVGLLASALFSACAVGPDYSRPAADVEGSWIESDAVSGQVPDVWWASLEDPVLAGYLADAAVNNRDIGIAVARVNEARALRGIARSAFWPQAAIAGSHTQFEQSIESPGAGGTQIDAGLIDRDVSFYTSSLDASWELDVFGGNRRLSEAADAQLGASIAQQEAAVLSVLSETAAAYFERRGAQERLAIAESNISSQQRTLELTRRKVDAGLGRRIDELRAQAQLDAVRAQVPALRASIRASTYRLGVLTGRRPEETDASLGMTAAMPIPPQALPVGTRADILRRRPDVVAAERQLAAATADIGVAKADFFPRFVLNASYGFEAENLGDLGRGRARTTALVPFVSWPLFQGGRLRANLEGANARAVAAALGYEQAVLVALADAESALTAYAEELATLERLQAAADASGEAANIAQRLYEQGLADFLTVLDAERRRDEAQDARARSHTRVLLNMARVYKALGGGWQVQASI